MIVDDTPAARIARLDEALARRGQAVTLRRRIGAGSTFVDLPTRARVVGYASSEVVGAVRVTDSKFIMSPSQLVAAGVAWPGVSGGDQWPVIGDFLVARGAQRRIEQTQAIVIGDVVVRIEGRIAG